MRARRLLQCAVALVLLAGAASRASAQGLEDYDYENLTFRGFGADYGMIWPDRVEQTGMYSLRIDLGYLGPGVRIAPSIGFWSSSLKRAERERLVDQLNEFGGDMTVDELGEIDWSDLYFNVDAHAVWTAPLGVLTYVGAGVGVHALNGQGQSIQNTFVEDLLDSITVSGDLIAGVEYPVIPRLRLYGEARFTLMSDIHYPGIRVGASFMLPPRTTAAAPATSGS
jgi:hypothetical protein